MTKDQAIEFIKKEIQSPEGFGSLFGEIEEEFESKRRENEEKYNNKEITIDERWKADDAAQADLMANALYRKMLQADFFNIEIIKQIQANELMLVEDGSVDTGKLDELGITYLVYRMGSNPPHWIKTAVGVKFG